jgi:multimeric flavodoxin WrbA
MKVLLLNGSANKKGNTFTALSEVAGQLEKNGIEAEIMQLGNKPVRGCIACGQCRMKQLGRCAFDDDVCNRIVDKLNEADALVVGSPVYYGQPNGAVMAVLQRAFFAGANVQNKPAAAVAVCRRGGATAAYQTLNMMFEMMNMPIVTSQYWNIAYGMAPGEVKQDTEGMQTMRTMADNMAWLLKKIHGDDRSAQPDYPEREPWQAMNFIR